MNIPSPCVVKCLTFLLMSLCVPTIYSQEQAVAPKSFSIPETDEDFPGEGPVRRYEWFRNLWESKRSGWAERVEADQNAVVFFGDSITQGWNDDFRGYFPDVKKANRGISGDTTRGMLFRLKEDVLSLNPRCIVMLMGTNDLEEGAEPKTIVSNIALILDAIAAQSEGIPVVLCKVFPSSERKKRPASLIREINDGLDEIVKAHANVTVLDTWTLFRQEDGDAKIAEFPDLLHPNALGYEKWAAALRPVFATLNIVEQIAPSFEVTAGFESLFTGSNLNGWGYRPTTPELLKSREGWKNRPEWPIVEEAMDFTGSTKSPDGRFVAINGKLVVTTPSGGRKIQQIYTTRDFDEDFTLRLEFRATPNADSGIFLRGKQLQCRDFPLAGPYKNLQKYKPLDWNHLEIEVSGTSAYCTCNGELLEADLLVPAHGPIGLEGDRGQVEYRNIQIRSEVDRYGLLRPTDDLRSWKLELAEQAQGELATRNGILEIKTTKKGDENWHVQVVQQDVPLEEDCRYDLYFEARSKTKSLLAVHGLIDEHDWHEIGLFQEFRLDEKFKTCRVSFVASNVIPGNNRISFIAGHDEGVIEIRNAKLRKRN